MTSRSLSNASFKPFILRRSRVLAAILRFFNMCGDGGLVAFLRPPRPFFTGTIVPSAAIIGCLCRDFVNFLALTLLLSSQDVSIIVFGGKGWVKTLVLSCSCNGGGGSK